MKFFQSLIFIPGVPGRVFRVLELKLDFEEIGVAGPEPDPAPREERERRAGSWEGSWKTST